MLFFFAVVFISRTFIILISIYYYLHFLSLIAQASSPAPATGACWALLCVHLELPGMASSRLCPAASGARPCKGGCLSPDPAGASPGRRGKLQPEICVGSSTELLRGYPTTQPGESHPQGSGVATRSSRWTAGTCGKASTRPSISPSLPPSKTLLWLML